MKIINTHCHLGDCWQCEIDYSEEDILKAMEENNLSSIILQPFPEPADVLEVHRRISMMANDYPGKIYGIISLNPHCDIKEYITKVKKIIDLGGFVGIKLHTLGHTISPLSRDSQSIYKIASDNNLPVMIHTGLCVNGEPSLALVPAKEYPEIKFILAHSGFTGGGPQSIVTALNSDNIYLETSFSAIHEKAQMISKLGSDRIMFGSDSIENISIEIAQFKKLQISKGDLENVLYRVAKEVFLPE